MYSKISNLVLGFHGCDKSVAEQVISGKTRLRPSQNDFDWLGNGIYFWEGNPRRALEYAQFLKDHPERIMGKEPIRNPAVVGAVLDLGHCLNLFETESISRMQTSYQLMKKSFKTAAKRMPQNKRPISEETDVLLRNLDCAVIQFIHRTREAENLMPYESVRGGFFEGEPIYPNAGVMSRNHIQICVVNPNCIKGYFRPLETIEQ